MAAVLDYHLHLWAHGEPDSVPTPEQLSSYCERAQAAGVTELALTEHLFRFAQADEVLRGFWEDEPDPALRSSMASYWSRNARADLDLYVEAVLSAKVAGLPVVLGLEVDFYRGRMHDVAALLAGYPFDVLLGSVHWLGTWLFDNLDDPVAMQEWERRGADAAWALYCEALEELADSGVCDVVAHPDLAKVRGLRPGALGPHHDRIAEAAARSGMAAEVSSAGLRKPAGEAYPAPELLARFRSLGVPVTTASDAHRLADVASGFDDLRPLLASAGYDELCAFRGRRRRAVPVEPAAAGGVC
jgi:histidinol-phosphatase (PHP family)